jgi:hypothetical protein
MKQLTFLFLLIVMSTSVWGAEASEQRQQLLKFKKLMEDGVITKNAYEKMVADTLNQPAYKAHFERLLDELQQAFVKAYEEISVRHSAEMAALLVPRVTQIYAWRNWGK